MSFPSKKYSKPELRKSVPSSSTPDTCTSVTITEESDVARSSARSTSKKQESKPSSKRKTKRKSTSHKKTTDETTTARTERKPQLPSSERASHLHRYLPATLHHAGKSWQVEYYVLNPDLGKLERHRIKMNLIKKHCRTLTEFKMRANEVIQDVNAKLAGGWTPFGETENSRYYTPISEVLALYVKERSKELKPETMRSYKSFANIFGGWADSTIPNCKAMYFNRTMAVRYMDWYYDEHSNPNTYNNMLKMTRAFFGWAKEKCYIKENPFELMKTKRKQEKRRILVPKEQRARIRLYFDIKRPEMVIVCELVYTSLIRPIEITRITTDMLHLKEGYIALPQNITKNGHARNAPLSTELIERLSVHVQYSKSGDYLFGSKWTPDEKSISDKAFRKQWDKMRKMLQLPDEMQLYSLRDTGMFDKIKSGVDPLTVMQAADHHDLAMTTRYANHYDPNMVKIISDADDF